MQSNCSKQRVKLIPYSDYIHMPWKNNQGHTLQIDIEKSDKYLWRLSAATVKNENSFSEFTGYDRFLTIWQGQGLLLNDFELLQNQIYKFRGEDKIICKPITHTEVIDLGFIFNRNHCNADMKILNLSQSQKLILDSELTFLFCSKGEFQIENHTCREGDTVKIQNEKSVFIALKSANARLVQIDAQIK